MSSVALDNSQVDQHLHHLLSEKLAGDSEAVRRVEALIQELNAARRTLWEPAPPDNIPNNRIPHC